MLNQTVIKISKMNTVEELQSSVREIAESSLIY